jgi:hypothetical protein
MWSSTRSDLANRIQAVSSFFELTTLELFHPDQRTPYRTPYSRWDQNPGLGHHGELDSRISLTYIRLTTINRFSENLQRQADIGEPSTIWFLWCGQLDKVPLNAQVFLAEKRILLNQAPNDIMKALGKLDWS